MSQDNENELVEILENSLNEIYIFDAETLKFQYINQCAKENLGYTSEEIYEITPIDIKPEITIEIFQKLIEPAANKNKKITFQTIHQRKNGSLYPVEVHLQKVTYQSRPAFVAFILDISEQKQSAKKLHYAYDIINRSNSAVVVWENKDGWPVKFISDNKYLR